MKFAFLLLITFINLQAYAVSDKNTYLKNDRYQVTFNEEGAITNFNYDGKKAEFRTDSLYQGPSLFFSDHKIVLHKMVQRPDILSFSGESGEIQVTICYLFVNDAFAIRVSAKNKTNQKLTTDELQLRIGINTEMDSFPHWNKVFFPTLLRCEKDFFWGYLMSPEGNIMAISSPDPVASWSNYYYTGAHLIYTINLDLMHCLPLPSRHPQNLNTLQANEERSWSVYLKPVDQLEKVKEDIVAMTHSVMISASQYTIAEKEKFGINLTGHVKECYMITPDQKKISLDPLPNFQYEPRAGAGVYTLVVNSSEGKTSEAVLTVRKPWSWYLQKAGQNAIEQEQKGGSHSEGWYGLFSMFLSQKYFPDHMASETSFKKFNELYPLMYDEKDLPIKFPDRIQNSACMASLLADMYSLTLDTAYLVKAFHLCDFLRTKQDEKGAFRNKKIHYTSVIYIAKSILEVCEQEKILAAASPVWMQRYLRHYASAQKAINELSYSLDNIQTEGQQTFEDGMISCSYDQTSMLATLTEERKERERLTEAAEILRNKHKCLSQLLVPDSRMNGGSLRFWESQYDILSFPNLISSPHGWSAFRIYGLFYLYQLTGNPELIEQVYNGLGTDVQVIDVNSGKLRWGFCVDPYIAGNPKLNDPVKTFPYDEQLEGNLLVRDPSFTGRENRGIRKNIIVGEQYLDMISGWYKAKPDTWVTGYWEPDGGCCDNDVHEIFKCLEETVLTNAFVLEQSDGCFKGYNCTIKVTGNALEIIPYENFVTNVHFNTRRNIQALVRFGSKEVKAEISGGELKWIRIKRDDIQLTMKNK